MRTDFLSDATPTLNEIHPLERPPTHRGEVKSNQIRPVESFSPRSQKGKKASPKSLFDNSIQGLLTAQDVASELGISKQFVYKLAKTKRLEPVLIGKAVRFKPEDIDVIRRGLRNL